MKVPNSYESYLKQKRRKKFFILFAQISVFCLFLFLWEWLVSIGFLNEFLVSKPTAIFQLFLTYLESNSLFSHIGISVLETIIGLIVGYLLGILIAILLYFSDALHRIIDPYLTVLNALPKTALAPILIIWAGTNMKGIIFVSISLSIVVTIISCLNYFHNTDKSYIKMLRALKASKLQILYKVVLPSNLANLISILKINIGLAWIGTIVGEFLVSRNGIGYLLMYGGMVFRLDLVMMGVFLLAIIAFLMYEAVNLLEKWLRRTRKHSIHKNNNISR